jgi:hypothetical protein
VDEDDVGILVDLVDDAELSATGGVQAFQFTSERLAGTMRVLGDRSHDGLDNGASDLRGKLIEVPESLRRDLDLVHA